MTNSTRASLVLFFLAGGCTLGNNTHHSTQPDAGMGSDPGSDTDAGSGSGSGSDPGSGSDSGMPISCTPGKFDTCDGDVALTCNATGDGFDRETCAHGCNPERGCNVCTPNATTCEANNVLQVCGADGLPASQETCNVACDPSPSPHCTHIEPRYLPNACNAEATADLDVAGNTQLDTTSAVDCNGGIVAQANGPSICVVRFKTIHVEAAATLRAIGPNALALVADTDLDVDGTLDVSATGRTSGPGGGFTSSGGASGATNGAGGAGFHSLGGNGGTVNITGGAANGGAAVADPVSLDTLFGGPSATGTNGGGGGGAATLISCQGEVRVSGTLTSAGGGGAALGGGGGAGGYIVLQGMNVHDSGNLFANGGGGGAGLAGLGADGDASLNHAAGGVGTVGSGNGGQGGAGAGPNGGPGVHPSSGTHPGGGGGGVGFFQTFTPANVTPDLHPVVVSPGFQPNATVPVI